MNLLQISVKFITLRMFTNLTNSILKFVKIPDFLKIKKILKMRILDQWVIYVHYLLCNGSIVNVALGHDMFAELGRQLVQIANCAIVYCSL